LIKFPSLDGLLGFHSLKEEKEKGKRKKEKGKRKKKKGKKKKEKGKKKKKKKKKTREIQDTSVKCSHGKNSQIEQCFSEEEGPSWWWNRARKG